MIKVIIPCFNEAERLSIRDIKSFMASDDASGFELLFVNDGSTDNTLEVLNQLSRETEGIAVLDLGKNSGKAEAIRMAMIDSTADDYAYVAYLDADLATPIEELCRMRDLARNADHPYLLMGSRVNLLGYSQIKRKAFRHYVGRIFATLVSKLLDLAIYDTQCGAKLIRSDLINELFKDPFTSKWLFDVELIFRLKKLKADFDQKIVEIPLKRWEDKSGSKIKFTYYLQAPFDLLKIYFRYK